MTLEAPASVSDIRGPKFSIITKAIQSAPAGDDGRRRFRATASSTVVDRSGDEIDVGALQKAAEQFRQGITIYMDHDFKHVESAFGLTDQADLIQRGNDPKTGAPIWDLDVSGVVNTPNPRAVQLADSIDGGFAKFGTSITAYVRKHRRHPETGGMKIAEIDVVEASIVGVPDNQRSWAQKAALAIKSFNFQNEDDEETIVTKELDTTDHETAETATTEAEAETTEATTETPETTASTADETGDQAAEEQAAESTTGVQESVVETPETTPEDEETEADPLEVKAAGFSPEDVAELVKQSGLLVSEIGRLREENARLAGEIETSREAKEAVSKEVDLATQVIGEVMKMPLRSKTAGYIGDFTKTHSLFDPDIADYLNKRERTTVKP